MDYSQALAFLDSLAQESRTSQGALKLQRITLLLDLLGNPQLSFKTLHVAGTSGKGSTCQILQEILSAHGLKTGLHVSPHIQVVNERMQVDGLMASRQELASLVETVEPLCSKVEAELGLGKPTFFETTLAMAFEHFRRTKCDYAVVETGLGGRLDGTNVLNPQVCVLTNVGLDHTQILGSTIEEIAREKAGIIKPGVPVVTAAWGTALEIFSQKASELSSPLWVLGQDVLVKDVACTRSGSKFNLLLPQGISYTNLELGLIGEHQVKNAALAIAAASRVVLLDDAMLKQALKQVRIPVRLEVMQQNPQIILDGAHNPPKAMALRQALGLLETRPLILVVGISATKDAAGILSELALLNPDQMIFTKGNVREFYSPQELAKLYSGKCMQVVQPADALKQAIELAKGTGTVCVTGSLYLAGELRQNWLSNETALDICSLKLSTA